MEQIELSGLPPKQKDNSKYLKQKWRNALQEYCDNQAITEGEKSGWCCCGTMNYCDLCDKPYKCVSAILKYANEKNIKISYDNYDFADLLFRLETVKEEV